MQYIVNDKKDLLRMAYDNRILGAIIASIFVSESIDKRIEKLTGEKNVSDILLKSLDHNVTTEMGFMLSRISDIARKNENVVEYLEKHEKDDNFLDGLKSVPGGEETSDALDTFLQRFGMRCPGEIDITRDRFVESPTKLIPIILNNIRVLKEGEYKERFDAGRNEALTKKKEILEIISKTPGGKRKAKKLEKNIDLLRNFSGCREDPKYYIVKRFMVYKRAILKEAELLVQKGKLEKSEDIFYLYIHELRDVIRGGNVDYNELNKRRTEFQVFEKLTPPRIFTSKGYVPKPDITVENLPEGAMPGIPVSSGIIEGRARVVLSINNAKVDEGDILVTRFTDPSWTPLFSTISGLVTEVGGFTTHGAIVAREYGLPSVVGVQNATTLIKDGQLIRVNGSEGYVEIIN